VGGDEGQDISLETLKVVVVEDLDGGVLDRSVPSIRPARNSL